MTDKRTLLLIDNNPAHAEVFREALLSANDGPFEGEFVTTLSQGLERHHKKGIWAIFVNLSLPDGQGLDTIEQLWQLTNHDLSPKLVAVVLRRIA